jgi:hypothetical protein
MTNMDETEPTPLLTKALHVWREVHNHVLESSGTSHETHEAEYQTHYAKRCVYSRSSTWSIGRTIAGDRPIATHARSSSWCAAQSKGWARAFSVTVGTEIFKVE